MYTELFTEGDLRGSESINLFIVTSRIPLYDDELVKFRIVNVYNRSRITLPCFVVEDSIANLEHEKTPMKE